MQSYHLDVATLLQILSRQKRSGTLQADLRLPREGEVRAYLEIEKGILRTCVLITKRGVLAEGPKAFQTLSSLGAQEWHWTTSPVRPQNTPRKQESSPIQLLPASPMRDAPLYPQRTSQVDLKTLSVFSRLHRRILALSDGTRSPQKIAAILSLDLQTVHQCLRELEAEGLITYQPSSESE